MNNEKPVRFLCIALTVLWAAFFTSSVFADDSGSKSQHQPTEAAASYARWKQKIFGFYGNTKLPHYYMSVTSQRQNSRVLAKLAVGGNATQLDMAVRPIKMVSPEKGDQSPMQKFGDESHIRASLIPGDLSEQNVTMDARSEANALEISIRFDDGVQSQDFNIYLVLDADEHGVTIGGVLPETSKPVSSLNSTNPFIHHLTSASVTPRATCVWQGVECRVNGELTCCIYRCVRYGAPINVSCPGCRASNTCPSEQSCSGPRPEC